MSGFCSKHKNHEPDCEICNAYGTKGISMNNELTFQERMSEKYKKEKDPLTCFDVSGAISTIKSLQSALAAEKEKVKELQTDHGNACKLVAQMHHAAVGEIVGPKHGVVEDIADLKARADNAEACCGQMREALESIELDCRVCDFNNCNMTETDLYDYVKKALSSPCGISWASPEEVGRLVEGFRRVMVQLKRSLDPHLESCTRLTILKDDWDGAVKAFEELESSFKQSQQAKDRV